MPVELAHISSERYLYPIGTHANNTDSSLSAVRYKAIPDRLKQMMAHEAVKE